MIPRLLERAARASRLACTTFGPLHSPPVPKNAANGGGLDMDVEESDAAGGSGFGRTAKGYHPGDKAGVATAEGVELLQVQSMIHIP